MQWHPSQTGCTVPSVYAKLEFPGLIPWNWTGFGHQLFHRTHSSQMFSV
uniref:Uncharacterized protein n=1 Tax=Anguilla anguilla TaxID=7936 RepID=A0A0E9R4I1_ANGAN